MSHIWLTGMMGTGKTTIGALVAERLERPLLDTDTMVMVSTRRTIPELFAESEARFRTHEREAIERASRAAPSVISTGGGAVMDPINVEVMRRTGSVILLTADPGTIADRLAGERAGRPLAGSAGQLEALGERRAAAYAAAADHTVDTTGREPGDIAEEVLACADT